jgi:hypothetical protein
VVRLIKQFRSDAINAVLVHQRHQRDDVGWNERLATGIRPEELCPCNCNQTQRQNAHGETVTQQAEGSKTVETRRTEFDDLTSVLRDEELVDCTARTSSHEATRATWSLSRAAARVDITHQLQCVVFGRPQAPPNPLRAPPGAL